MSTIGYSNWAVDLKDVAAVYPFQGWEYALVLAAFAFWILWHIIQIVQENREFAEDKKGHFTSENVRGAVDRY
jgi:hypothetical protein